MSIGCLTTLRWPPTSLASYAPGTKRVKIRRCGNDSDSIYAEHLQWQQLRLQRQPELVTAYAQVLAGTTADPLDVQTASLLQSLGLITVKNSQAAPSCKLYEQFFKTLGSL